MVDHSKTTLKGRKLSVDEFVGSKLEELRLASNQSDSDLGTLLSVPTSDIPKFVSGRKRISAAQLFVLARHFGVPVAAFFGIELEAA